MSEETFVRYCSPTLAGIKTANLFSGCFADEEEMREGIRRLNGILVKKGIRVLPLKYHEGRALIYVYRPMRLRQDLERADVRSLLQEYGYICGAPEHCIVQLMRRLAEERDYPWGFPHEIGLFLGIPPEDVRGFIENRAEKRLVCLAHMDGETASGCAAGRRSAGRREQSLCAIA